MRSRPDLHPWRSPPSGSRRNETQNLFNTLDEDYHMSRFLHFSNKEGKSYLISGTEITHVSIDATIQSIL